MSDFNAAQVLAEAYTLYKKHYDGMGLDFKIAIAQVRKEAEQRGKEQAWDQCRDSIITAGRDHTEHSSNALDPGLTLTAFLDYTEKALANPYRADQEGNE